MKRQFLFANIEIFAKTGLISGLLLYSVFSQAQLTYTQITGGLNAVSFESGYTELEVGDVDGDGDLDIVSIGDHGSPNINATEGGIMVWKNNGSGTSWSLAKTGNFGYGGVALGDVNNDGKMDIGYGMHHEYSSTDFGDQLLEVALGDGTGSNWTPYDDSLAGVAEGQSWGMFGIDFGDVNNDGLLDLASNSFGCCDGIWVYKNNGDGSWTMTDGNLGGNSEKWCQMGDFNNDGNIDIAASSQNGNVFKNDGLGNFSSMQTGLPSDWKMKFDIADVNNDGGKDIAVISSVSTSIIIYTYNKTLNTWQNISTGLPTSGILGVALDDMDMDGNCDLLAWTTTGITIYKGDGTGINWTANGTIPVATASNAGFRYAATGDFDHDGYTDIAYFGNTGGNNSLKVFLHTVSNPALNIIPEFPKGYECFAQGSVQFVKWLSSVPSGPNATVSIDFSSTGAGGPWINVAINAPNNGTYQWIVPNVNSSNCFLKFTLIQSANSQSVILSNPFGIGTCITPPTAATRPDVSNLMLDIYPNPFRESTTLAVQGWNIKVQDWQLQVFDVMGRTVHQQTLNSQVSDISPNLPAGIYFVEIRGGNNILNEKIVIIK
ncbi:MAG: T9SS type A sorting domain-containing protein [Bacteroidetes bacterium]|nr:MAG: T9SS type A sorting domain-containing protein [Bacteroidota bacterium]